MIRRSKVRSESQSSHQIHQSLILCVVTTLLYSSAQGCLLTRQLATNGNILLSGIIREIIRDVQLSYGSLNLRLSQFKRIECACILQCAGLQCSDFYISYRLQEASAISDEMRHLADTLNYCKVVKLFHAALQSFRCRAPQGFIVIVWTALVSLRVHSKLNKCTFDGWQPRSNDPLKSESKTTPLNVWAHSQSLLKSCKMEFAFLWVWWWLHLNKIWHQQLNFRKERNIIAYHCKCSCLTWLAVELSTNW